jgi:hypothetical protein
VPLALILHQINPIYDLPFYFFNIYFNAPPPPPPSKHRSSKWSFSHAAPPKYCKYISSHPRITMQITGCEIRTAGREGGTSLPYRSDRSQVQLAKYGPVISNALDPLTNTLRQEFCNRRRREASRHLLPTVETQALMSRWDKYLNVNSVYVKVWRILYAAMCHV